MKAAQKELPARAKRKAQPFCDVSVFLPSEFTLDSGEKLSRPELRVRIYGELDRPAIVAAGGISAGRTLADAKDGEGWWREIVCRGGAVDLNQFCVIGFDFLPNAGETARTINSFARYSTADHRFCSQKWRCIGWRRAGAADRHGDLPHAGRIR